MRYVVPDTCAIAAGLFVEQWTGNCGPMIEAIRRREVEAIAPAIGLAEFLSVARKKMAGADLSPLVIDSVVADFFSLPITWWDIDEASTGLTQRCWRTHRTHSVGAWDAYFLLLAQDFQAEVWTTDKQFYQTASALYPNVHDLQAKPFA